MINLLPPDVKQEALYGRRNTHLRWYVGYVLVFGASAALALLGTNWFASQELQRLDEVYATRQQELAPYKVLTEEAKALEAKIETLKQLFDKETNYVALLEDIEATIVPGAQLQQLELNGDSSLPLEMRFSINNKLLAATLRNSLEDSDRFKFVDIQDITESETDTGVETTVTYKLSYETGQSR